MIHDFHERLAWGERAGDEPFWEAVYRRAFADFVSFSRNGAANTGQHLGIDRWIHLSTGKTLLVDEKKRSRADTSDIALEYVSNSTRKTPGWIEKDLQIDYLAYAFIPVRICFLFPWPILRRVWRVLGEDWKKKYRTISAQNRGYDTLSLVIPTDVLIKNVGEALRVTLPPEVAAPVEAATAPVLQLPAPKPRAQLALLLPERK